jgi:hypothetical protein
MPNRPWTIEEKVNAIFDTGNKDLRQYRYMLTCSWNDSLEKVSFIMLNPSIADASVCDPTLQCCIDFSKSWGYGGMIISNLFSYISPYPSDLKKLDDPVGPESDKYIIDAATEAEKIVFAWGQSFKGTVFRKRENEVVQLLKDFPHFCILKTKDSKYPRHPLYLRKDLTLIPYNFSVYLFIEVMNI